MGEELLAEGCTSAAVRTEGAGGAYLLFITSDSVLHTVPVSRLQEGLPLTGAELAVERCDGQPSQCNCLAASCLPG